MLEGRRLTRTFELVTDLVQDRRVVCHDHVDAPSDGLEV